MDEALPLLAGLLGIRPRPRSRFELGPQRQKQRTLEVLIEQLAGLARARPVLELYEDDTGSTPRPWSCPTCCPARAQPAGAGGAHRPTRASVVRMNGTGEAAI